MSNILNFLRNPWRWYKERQAFKNRLKKLKEDEPFIYW
jgi:hypothetical protein